MGPRPIGRGNNEGPKIVGSRNRLQWGRDQLVAEIKLHNYFFPSAARLQWGRDQLVAEIYWEAIMRDKMRELQWGRDQLVAEIKEGKR